MVQAKATLPFLHIFLRWIYVKGLKRTWFSFLGARSQRKTPTCYFFNANLKLVMVFKCRYFLWRSDCETSFQRNRTIPLKQRYRKSVRASTSSHFFTRKKKKKKWATLVKGRKKMTLCSFWVFEVCSTSDGKIKKKGNSNNMSALKSDRQSCRVTGRSREVIAFLLKFLEFSSKLKLHLKIRWILNPGPVYWLGTDLLLIHKSVQMF